MPITAPPLINSSAIQRSILLLSPVCEESGSVGLPGSVGVPVAGINDSLKEENPIETMDKDTVVKLDIDLEKLYYNMVDCKAEWLYSLPQWDNLLSEERRKELYKEQKNSGTIHNANRKVGRNDP